MKYKKGQSGNYAGRPSGTKNKATEYLREMITAFLQANQGRIQTDFDSMEPKDRMIIFEKLLKYSVPALQSVEVETVEKDDRPVIIFQDVCGRVINELIPCEEHNQ